MREFVWLRSSRMENLHNILWVVDGFKNEDAKARTNFGGHTDPNLKKTSRKEMTLTEIKSMIQHYSKNNIHEYLHKLRGDNWTCNTSTSVWNMYFVFNWYDIIYICTYKCSSIPYPIYMQRLFKKGKIPSKKWKLANNSAPFSSYFGYSARKNSPEVYLGICIWWKMLQNRRKQCVLRILDFRFLFEILD